MKRLVLLLAFMSLACGYSSAADAQECAIEGPASVAMDQSFTLCGPTGSGYRYDWYGPGVEGDADTRCISARLSSAGTFEYELVISRYGRELDRCKKLVNAGGSSGGARSCTITGPTSIQAGQTARLCGPNDPLHTYSWTGPNGYRANGSCVTVTQEGTYYLTTRNTLTGSTRQCTHHLDVIGGAGGESDCISGPTTVPNGGSVRLCAPSRANTTYRWNGPKGFTASGRCATIDEPGTYTVSMRDEDSGRIDRCLHRVTSAGGGNGEDENPDDEVWDNCPRPLQFWRDLFDDATGSGDLSASDLRAIARYVDDHSSYFNWGNDIDGMRQALRPARPMTRRKQLTRQYATLLANVAAGELGVTPRGRNQISLDLDTPLDNAGAATIRDLISTTERTLRGRGTYSRLTTTLTRINRGEGIGTVCD